MSIRETNMALKNFNRRIALLFPYLEHRPQRPIGAIIFRNSTNSGSC